MKLDKFAAMIPENGAQMLDRLNRKQPPAGDVYDGEMLDIRAHAAANWFRGYADAMQDVGRITDKDGDEIYSQIFKLEGDYK